MNAQRTFRSLSGFNYRVWAGGAFVSNVGTWLQRTAQSWVVLTELTDNNATAVGIVMALQFGPLFLLLPLERFCGRSFRPAQTADRDTGSDGFAGAGAWVFSPSAGLVQLWHVYVFAFLLGCVAAFDTPARQTLSPSWSPRRICPMRWRSIPPRSMRRG